MKIKSRLQYENNVAMKSAVFMTRLDRYQELAPIINERENKCII